MRRLFLSLLLFISVAAQAAVTHVGGAAGDEGANTTGITLTLPSHATDDFGVVCAFGDGDPTAPVFSIGTATGWSTLRNDTTVSGRQITTYVFYKKFTSASETNPVLNTDQSDSRGVVLNVFRGVDTTTAFDVTEQYTDTENVVNPSNPAITTVTNNAAVLLCLGQSLADATTTGAPSGYTLGQSTGVTQNHRHTASAYDLDVGALGTETPGAWTNGGSDGVGDNQEYTMALRPAAGGVTFSVSPTVDSTTASTYVMTYTVSGATTVYFVGCNPDESAPSSAQVEAGDCGSGADAEVSANEAVSGADTTTISSVVLPRHDIYAIPESGGSVVTLSDENRTADAGQTIVVLASVATTSVFDVDTYYDPDVAAGDVFEADDVAEADVAITDVTGDTDGSTAVITGMADTSDFLAGHNVTVSAGFASTGPFEILSKTSTTITVDTNSNSSQTDVTVTVTYPITWETDGDFSYPDPAAVRTNTDYCIQDITGAGGDFTTPACWGADDVIWVNNSAPVGQTDLDPVVFTEDAPITTLDLDVFFTDADSDALTYTITSGTIPIGLSLNGSNGEITGTPTTENESGVTMIFEATDVAGDTDTITFLIYIVNTVTLPTLDDSTQAAAISDFQTAFPWQTDILSLTASFACSSVEAADQVISQSPAASTEVTAFEEVDIVVSLGDCSVTSGGKGATLPGLRIGM